MTEYVGTYERDLTRTLTARTPDGDAVKWLPHQRSSGRQWVATYRTRLLLGDLLVGILGSAGVVIARFGASTGEINAVSYAIPFAWVLALAVGQAYRSEHFGVGSDEYRSIGRAAVWVACLVSLCSYAFGLQLSRAVFLSVVPIVLLGSLVVHWTLRRDLGRRREQGLCLLQTIVVGRADSVATMIREIRSAPQNGMVIVGACVSPSDGLSALDSVIEGVPVFGPPESALAAVDGFKAQVVAVSSHPDLVGQPLRRLGWALAERGVDLVVSPGIIEVAGPRLSLRPAAGLSLLHVERPIANGARIVVKRIVDLAMTVGLIAAISPLMLLIGALVAFTSEGPVFYRQERVGARGETFRMIKFRSMVLDADKIVGRVLDGHSVNAILFKSRSDPRITPVGAWIRRFSLDELPQLFNVLLGDMSLVGPRPPLPREVAKYEADAVQRLRVRPGMTGMWQISGRSDLNWEQSLRLDLWYVDNWSPMLDLQILVRTGRAVLSGRGAY